MSLPPPLARPQKVILVGHDGIAGETDSHTVESVSWEALGSHRSLRDYDVVILNILDRAPDLSPSTHTRIFSPQLFADVVGHGGLIVVVGDPRFEVSALHGREDFLDWTGMRFRWRGGRGDTVLIGGDSSVAPFGPYVRHIREWEYALEAAGIAGTSAHGIEVRTEKLAATRFNAAVASRHWLTRKDSKGNVVNRTGPLVLLPKTGLATDEALRVLLVDALGIQLEAGPPPWLDSAVRLAKHEAVHQALLQTRNEIRVHEEQAERLQEQLRAESRHTRLLYEIGTGLEKAVLEAFAVLGASVTEPSAPGREDGWIAVEFDGEKHEAVLEIKGTRSDSFPETGIRQLLDWVNRGIVEAQTRYKPIFVGNNAIGRTPSERTDPFSPSWRKAAALADVSSLLTEDLYRAVLLAEQDRLDRLHFWRTLFKSSGVADLGFLRKAVPDVTGRLEATPR